MICTTFKSSPLRIFAAVIALIVVGYLTLALAAGSNPNRIIQTSQGRDYRVQGVLANGWSTPNFTFSEDKLYSFGAIVQFTFETSRPKEAGAAQFVLRAGDTQTEPVTIGRDPIVAPSPTDKFTSISISATAKNPFRNDASPEQQLGAKLASTEIKGRYHLLLPVIWPILPLLLAFAITTTALCMLFGRTAGACSFLPIPLAVIALYLMHHQVLFELWSRDAWLWGAAAFLCVGCVIAKRLRLQIIREEKSVTKFHLVVLAVVFIFGLWLRISAVQFGLPQLYHPDESRKIKIARHIIESGDLDPNYFRHPSFMVYSTALLGKVKSIFTGTVPNVSELAVLGRSVSAVLGALTIIVLFYIGTILFGAPAGLLAASLLSVAPLHVVCSRYIKEDVCMTFFSLWSLYCVLLYCYRAPKKKYLLFAGLLAGFASSVKYTGVLSVTYLAAPLLLTLILAILEKTSLKNSNLAKDIRSLPLFTAPVKQHATLLVGALALLVIGFLMITPYSVFNKAKFLEDFLTEKEHMDRGHGGTVTAAAHYWTYHLKYSIVPALTSPISILSLAFLAILFGMQQVGSYVLILGVLLFYLPSESINTKPFPQPERYILPCIPFLALAAGGFLQLVQSYYSTFRKPAGQLFAIALICGAPLWYSVMHRAAALHDTRQLATDWVVTHIPNGSTIVTDWYFYSPSFSSGNYTVKELKQPANVKLLRELSLGRVQNTGAQYFISSSFFYQRFLAQVKRGNKTALGFHEIFTKLKPSAVFSKKEYSYGFHNPTIRIYMVPPKSK